jgi:NAD+ diphosphatase
MNFFDSKMVEMHSDLANLGFSTSTLNRSSDLREKADWQAAALNDNPTTRFILFCKDTPVLGFDGAKLEALFDRQSLKDFGQTKQSLFLGVEKFGVENFGVENLGVENETPYFGVELDASHFDDLKLRDDLKLIDMRSIAMQGLFAPSLLSAIGTAKAMLHWHNRHRFCSNCGAQSTLASSGWKRSCVACKAEHFPRTDPVVIMLAVNGDRCLMGRNAAFPEGRYSCLAGFMEPGETIEDATRREILEETNIRTGKVRYLTAQPWPFPSSLMIGCMAEATSFDITIDPNELADARWFTRDEVRQILVGTHPAGITAPPRMAIANHIMQIFVDAG